MTPLRILILGGTTEALELSEALRADARFEPLLSLAGVTRSPRLPSIRSRVGGFGGVNGLVRYFEQHHFQALVLATHPFAAQIRSNAIAAVRHLQCPLLIIDRPSWREGPDDRWRHVPNVAAAATELGKAPKRVLLT